MVRIRATLAAFALVALPARAQFQPVVMKVKGVQQQAELGALASAGGGDDLLILLAGGTPPNRELLHHDLLAVLPSPYTGPASLQSAAVGAFHAGTSTLPDVAWAPAGTPDLAVSWGEAPATWTSFTNVYANRWSQGLAAVRLLPRDAPVLVATTGYRPNAPTYALVALDLMGRELVSPPPGRSWSVPAYARADNGDVSHDRIFPLRLSPGARGGQVDDALVPFSKGFFMLWHDSAPSAGATLDQLAITAIDFGSPTGSLSAFLPPELAATLPAGSCLGGSATDVDGDGDPDLVFSYGALAYPELGGLLWIPNEDDPAAMKAAAWQLLSGRPDLAAITSVGTLREIELDGGERAFAVNDRVRQKLVVVRGGGPAGFSTIDLPLDGGAELANAVAIDVVGSPARDLVALVDVPPTYLTSEVWIYPDVGDPAPRLAWSPEPPATAPLGQDLTLSVDASTSGAAPLTLRWIRPPAADVLDVPSLAIPGASLCTAGAVVDVTVRAMDPLGVYVTVQGRITIEERPSLSIVGAAPPGRVVLLPGGTAVRAEGAAWPACGGSPTLEWGLVGFTGGVWAGAQPDGIVFSNELTIPESAYADLLDGPAGISLRGVDPASVPARDGTAQVDLLPDATGLVSAQVEFDGVALGAGELGLARVRLASRLGVPMPAVRASVRLAGLAFAGPLEVRGAPATPGPADGEVIVDPLPALGATVEILVPVRSLAGGGGVSVELYSSGDVRLSPEANPSLASAPLPGCGCGPGGASGLPILALLAALRARGRRAGSSTT